MVQTVVCGEVAEATGPVVEFLSSTVLDLHWAKIEEELLKVPHLWADRWTMESLYYKALSHHMQVWAAGVEDEIRLIIMSQVAIYPAARILEIVLAFGRDLDRLLPVIDASMEKFAFMQQCSFIDVIGRKGWERKLARLGGKHVASIMRRPVVLERIQ